MDNNGNKYFYNTGNVGIGTNDPKTLLSIKGTNPVLTIMGQGGTGAKSQINLSTYDEAANQASCSISQLIMEILDQYFKLIKRHPEQ